MRNVVTTLLVSLILVCPFVCGAAEACHVTHREHAAGGSAPSHCPEDNDGCVCRGAVQSSDVRIPNSDAIGISLPLDELARKLAHSPAHSLVHLTTDGHPTGLAGWGDSLAVRAFLQNFRF